MKMAGNLWKGKRSERRNYRPPSSGTLQAHITETTSNPCRNKPESTRIGLGIWLGNNYKGMQSLVGGDRTEEEDVGDWL